MTDAITIRQADLTDVEWIAQLHADSWRRNYRGVYADAFLDADLVGERTEVWKERLHGVRHDTFTLIAEYRNQRTGFLHAELDCDPHWGVLIDNLHIRHDLRRTGTGTRLMAEAAVIVADNRPQSGVYLWVQEQNEAARAFYLAMGGTIRGREPVSPPSADPQNLTGSPAKLRVAWPNPSLITAAGR
jgi:ribosomal protein S18 acetylase RimI-like enzyme